jgi:hypothetical protein
MSERGWAGQLLTWSGVGGLLQEARIGNAVYYVERGLDGAKAWALVREGGRVRVELGRHPTIWAARRACEADARVRCGGEDRR